MKFRRNTPEDEYQKDPNLKKDDVQQIITWLEKQPHMPSIDEYIIILFYNATGYSLQKTKELLDLHYTYRNEAPELFPDNHYEQPRYQYNIWDIIYVIPLPKPTPEGYRLVYAGFKDFTPSKYNFEISTEFFSKAIITVAIDQGVCPGYSVVFDIQGICLNHLATVSISLVRKFLYFSQEAAAVEVKAIHLINVTPILDKIMFLARPFLKKQLLDLIHIHSDINDFYKVVPRECIPTDIDGGTLPATRNEIQDLFKLKFVALKDFIEQDSKLRVDESKRPTSTTNVNSLSMHGSFKKLAID